MKHKRDREEACHICGHYHDYEGGEPCSICGHVIVLQQADKHENVIPTTVIPGFLYLGNYDSASRAELLKAMNISHILNSVPSCQALYKNTFTYHSLTESPPDFEECFKFLDSVNAQKGKVLVYCMSGASRSPSIVVGYLMQHRRWRLLESFRWVKDRRPNISINPNDTKRLVELELLLHGSSSVPAGITKLDDALATAGGFGFSMAPAQPAASPAMGTLQQGPIFGGPQVTFGIAQPSNGPAGPGPFVFGGPVQQHEQGNDMEQ